MSFLTLLSNQSANQTIVVGAPVASSQVFNPAVIPAGGSPQTIVFNAPVASSQVYNPAVVPGAVTIITAAPTPSSSVFTPRVLQASNQTIVFLAPVASSQVFTPDTVLNRKVVGSYPGPVSTDPQLMPYRKIKEPKRVNYRSAKRRRRERRDEEAMILFFTELFDE